MIPVNSLFTEFFNDPFFRTLSCPYVGSPPITWQGDFSSKGATNNAWGSGRNPPCCAVNARNTTPCCPMATGNLNVPSCCPRSDTTNMGKAIVLADGNLRDRQMTVPTCCPRSDSSNLGKAIVMANGIPRSVAMPPCCRAETNHAEKTMTSRKQVPKSIKSWVPLNCCSRTTDGARMKHNDLKEVRSEPVTVYNPITSETRTFQKRRVEPLRAPNASPTILRDQDVFAQAIQCVPPVFRTPSSRNTKPIKFVQPMKRDKEPETASKQPKEAVVGEESPEPGTQWSGFEPHLVSIIEQEVVERDTGVRWEDVAGQEEAKSALREAVVLPTKLPELFRGARRPWKGVLLVGPPGTGKTLLARAAASECRPCTFFNVSSATLTSRYRGESEKLVRLLFAMAAEKAPSVIFIDEIDALCSDRSDDSEHEASRRFKSELLVQMDGLGTRAEKLVVVLAATNHPWDIDEAFRRRFERRIYVPLPDLKARRELLRVKLRDVSLAADVDADAVATRLGGFSGSDVADVCREAAMAPLRRLLAAKGVDQLCNLPPQELQLPVSAADLDDAASRCKRTVSRKHVRRLQDWVHKYASS